MHDAKPDWVKKLMIKINSALVFSGDASNGALLIKSTQVFFIKSKLCMRQTQHLLVQWYCLL